MSWAPARVAILRGQDLLLVFEVGEADLDEAW